VLNTQPAILMRFYERGSLAEEIDRQALLAPEQALR
jgi:hypothetical protein